MFVANEDFIPIKIFYKKNGKKYQVYSENDFLKATIKSEEKSKFLELNIKMRVLTWGMYNDLQKILDEKNEKLYKEEKLKRAIIDWDAKKNDKNGKEIVVPITNETISSLCPEIAEKILSEYDAEMFLSEKEEQKIGGQVHNYIMSGGKSSKSISRGVIENDLIEEFSWLPQDIAKIPYKSLQTFYLIRKTKQYARQSRKEVDDNNKK